MWLSPLPSYNRTILELKLDYRYSLYSLRYSYNRTILELKLIEGYHEGNTIEAYNRTILELKPFNSCKTQYFVLLIIAPFWN